MRCSIQSILLVLSIAGATLAAIPPPAPDSATTETDSQDPAPSSTAAESSKNDYDVSKYSQCFNYFYKKDGCVHSALEDDKRCPANDNKPKHQVPSNLPMVLRTSHHSQQTFTKETGLFSGQGKKGNFLAAGTRSTYSQEYDSSQETTVSPPPPPPSRLVRRYDSLAESFTVKGGNGICGNYTDDQPGVCVWASASSADGSASGGWISGTFTPACGNQIFIQRKSRPGLTVYANVVDGCSFNENDPQIGCFRIAFTNKTFYDLQPSDEEAEHLQMTDLIWDYNNLFGDKPENFAP